MIYCFALFISLFISAIFIPPFIKWMKKIQPQGQIIKDCMPENHQKKAGTPTMGGVFIVLSIIINILFTAIIFEIHLNREMYTLLFAICFFGGLGIYDDCVKSISRYKSLKRDGIKSFTKLFYQMIGGLISLLILDPEPILQMPFLGAIEINTIIYYSIAITCIAAASNATNLTDGLDGLLGCTSIPPLLFLLFVSIALQNPTTNIMIIGIIGSLIGFLIYNHKPAKIFMGDSGSLPLGACGFLLAIMNHVEILFIIASFVCVFELLSVFLQIISIRFFKKRIFLLAPFHHHLELKGWKEEKIILSFIIISIFSSIFAYTIYLIFFL